MYALSSVSGHLTSYFRLQIVFSHRIYESLLLNRYYSGLSKGCRYDRYIRRRAYRPQNHPGTIETGGGPHWRRNGNYHFSPAPAKSDRYGPAWYSTDQYH